MRSTLPLLFLIGACCTPQLGADAPPQVASIWQLHTGASSFGSAIPVRCEEMPDGRYLVTMLTAKHVVQPPRPTYWAERQGALLEDGRVAANHPTLDASLVRFTSDVPVATIAVRTSALYIGERLWISGFGGDRFWIGTGLASATNRATVPAFSGDSGGAILDRNGELVGITSRIGAYGVPWTMDLHVVHHHCMFVPAADLNDWLQAQLLR